jgi:RNA polymerase sigma-70 factor, ECF subfamily
MRPEEELVQGIARRDSRIFEEFVRRYQHIVFFTSLRMLGENDEALDSSQEVFLKIWRSSVTARKIQNLKSWVYRVTINTCIDRLRERRRVDDLTTNDNVIWLTLPSQKMSPKEYASQLEEFKELKAAMNELTKRQRSVFVLRHFQNLKLQEISEIMEMPVGTVKSTLHQTLLKLRGLLTNSRSGNNGAENNAQCGER